MKKIKGENSIASKQHNRGLVLQLIITEKCNSRIEISKITGLSKMTVSNIISEYIQKGIIVEGEEELTAVCGRNPIKLTISKNAPKIVGLLIFRERCEAVLCNVKLEVIKRESINLDRGLMTQSELIEDIFHVVDKVIDGEKNILGIGVAVLGPVDIKNEIILKPVNFHGLQNIGIGDILRNKYEYPIIIDHDNSSAALAELLFGKGRGYHDFIFMGITNGIGSGVITGGDLFRNHRGYPPEIGHVSIERNGRKCLCGNTGCLETYASVPLVVQELNQATGLNLGFEEYCKLSEDPKVDRIFMDMIENLAIALMTSVKILQPELIIIGHEAIHLDDKYLKILEEKINIVEYNNDMNQVYVTKAFFKKDAQLLGAVCNVLVEVFKGDLLT